MSDEENVRSDEYSPSFLGEIFSLTHNMPVENSLSQEIDIGS